MTIQRYKSDESGTIYNAPDVVIDEADHLSVTNAMREGQAVLAQEVDAKDAEIAVLNEKMLILRRQYHNVSQHNQFFERCEDPFCNPHPPLGAAFSTAGDTSMIPGDRAKVEKIISLDAEIERLTDLVRYERHHLFDAKLLSETEYAALVADSEGGQRVARLEGYDKMRSRLAALEAEVERLGAPVSDEESINFGRWTGVRQIFLKEGIDALITARKESK